MQGQERVHGLLIRCRGNRAGKQRHQLLGLGSLLLRQPERVAAGHPVGRHGLKPDHRALQGVGPVGSLGRPGHLFEPLRGLLGPLGVLTGEVQVGIGSLLQVAASERRGSDLGPDPCGGVTAGERAVLPERLRILPQAVGLVAPALGIGGASAGGARQGSGEGPPRHVPLRPSMAR
jgi:hypothetical protein